MNKMIEIKKIKNQDYVKFDDYKQLQKDHNETLIDFEKLRMNHGEVLESLKHSEDEYSICVRNEKVMKVQHDEVWKELQKIKLENDGLKLDNHTLQCEVNEVRQSASFNYDGELAYRDLKSRYHALEEELESMKNVEQLAKLLATEYTKDKRCTCHELNI